MDFTWRVEEDLHGSDHFPFILESHYHPPHNRPAKWQFHKADSHLFKDISEAFLQDNLDGGFQQKTFFNKCCEIDNEAIPKSNPNPKKPWFFDECSKLI